jgi:pimeloyl-[acyl-carrier protein] methyl ester esterase
MTLHVSTAGEGPLLVLLHGWGLNSRVWDPVLPRLNRQFTTACIDLPGHGASPWPPTFGDIESLAARVGETLDSHIGECFILGWSLGAMAALALASKRAHSIRRLVLVAATPKFLRSDDWPLGIAQQALDDMAERVIIDFHATVRDFLLWQVHGDEHARQALKVLRDKVQSGGEPKPEALRAGLDTLARVDLRSQLPSIEIPALIVSGERDRLAHPDAGRTLAKSLPHAQFHPMQRAAHAPFLSHGEEFCTEVERFLADKP